MLYHFESELTMRDCKRTIPHRFDVPDGCTQLDIDFRFAPPGAHEMKQLLTLTLFDTAGFRGSGHRSGDCHQVHIDAGSATPGYLPGPLPAGPWTVEIDAHRIMPGEPVRYQMDVALAAGDAVDAVAPATPPDVVRVARDAPGWYRGDLHTHTYHSDAKDRTVAQLLRSARERGLDFVFLTDHNTPAGLPEMDVSSTGDLLAAGGVELTTFWGHALCLGARAWVDWRAAPGSGGMARIAEAAYAAGQLFVIAHPQADGDPGCTGCAWRFGDMMPGTARLVEVWNGPWGCDSNNEKGLALWYDWLNQGLRLVATAGTDSHSSRDYGEGCGFSVIYAEALSEAALLDGLRAGHCYLSAGPRVAFEALDERGARWLPGDTTKGPVTFSVAWDGCPPDAQVRVIVNGKLLDRWESDVRGERAWPMTPDQAEWVVIEVRGADGGMLAVTNPIFSGRPMTGAAPWNERSRDG